MGRHRLNNRRLKKPFGTHVLRTFNEEVSVVSRARIFVVSVMFALVVGVLALTYTYFNATAAPIQPQAASWSSSMCSSKTAQFLKGPSSTLSSTYSVTDYDGEGACKLMYNFNYSSSQGVFDFAPASGAGAISKAIWSRVVGVSGAGGGAGGSGGGGGGGSGGHNEWKTWAGSGGGGGGGGGAGQASTVTETTASLTDGESLTFQFGRGGTAGGRGNGGAGGNSYYNSNLTNWFAPYCGSSETATRGASGATASNGGDGGTTRVYRSGYTILDIPGGSGGSAGQSGGAGRSTCEDGESRGSAGAQGSGWNSGKPGLQGVTGEDDILYAAASGGKGGSGGDGGTRAVNTTGPDAPALGGVGGKGGVGGNGGGIDYDGVLQKRSSGIDGGGGTSGTAGENGRARLELFAFSVSSLKNEDGGSAHGTHSDVGNKVVIAGNNIGSEKMDAKFPTVTPVVYDRDYSSVTIDVPSRPTCGTESVYLEYDGDALTRVRVPGYYTYDCILTFKNGAQTVYENRNVTPGTKPTAPNGPQKTGYTFRGWNTSASATGAWYTDNGSINTDATYYAVYDGAKVDVLLYSDSSSTASGTRIIPEWGAYSGVLPTQVPIEMTNPTKAGYIFNGYCARTISSSGALSSCVRTWTDAEVRPNVNGFSLLEDNGVWYDSTGLTIAGAGHYVLTLFPVWKSEAPVLKLIGSQRVNGSEARFTFSSSVQNGQDGLPATWGYIAVDQVMVEGGGTVPLGKLVDEWLAEKANAAGLTALTNVNNACDWIASQYPNDISHIRCITPTYNLNLTSNSTTITGLDSAQNYFFAPFAIFDGKVSNIPTSYIPTIIQHYASVVVNYDGAGFVYQGTNPLNVVNDGETIMVPENGNLDLHFVGDVLNYPDNLVLDETSTNFTSHTGPTVATNPTALSETDPFYTAGSSAVYSFVNLTQGHQIRAEFRRQQPIHVHDLEPLSRVYDGTTNVTMDNYPATFEFFDDQDNAINNVTIINKPVNTTGFFITNHNADDAHKSVYYANSELGGSQGYKYYLSTTKSVDTRRQIVVSPRPLNVETLSYVKSYDLNTSITPSNTTRSGGQVSGCVAGEGCSLTSGSNLQFSTKNAGLRSVGIGADGAFPDLTGTGNFIRSNYAFTIEYYAQILPRDVYADGAVVDDKVYDAGFEATIHNQGELRGLDGVLYGVAAGETPINADALELDGCQAQFENVNAGVQNVHIYDCDLTGDFATNYNLVSVPAPATDVRAEITPLPVILRGLAFADKEYDATSDLTSSGTPTIEPNLDLGQVGVVIDQTLTFPSANVSRNVSGGVLGQEIKANRGNVRLTGTKAGNYSIQGSGDVVLGSATITPKALNASGLTFVKYVDGTCAAGDSAMTTYNLSGFVGTQSADLSLGDTTLLYAPNNYANDGTCIVTHPTTTVSFPINGFALVNPINGFNVNNYDFHKPILATGYILAQDALYISGVTASSKVYDGNAIASISGTPVLNGVHGGDDVALDPDFTLNPTGVFVESKYVSAANQHVGDSKFVKLGKSNGSESSSNPTVDSIELVGADVDKYVLLDLSLFADVTPVQLNVEGLSNPTSRVYDGTNSANVTGTPSLSSGVISGDSVSLISPKTIGTFETKNVGVDKPIRLEGFELEGNIFGDYVLNVPNDLKGTVTTKNVSVSNYGVFSKYYDATVKAEFESAPTVDPIVHGDEVSLLVPDIEFASKDAGVRAIIKSADFAIDGEDALNYNLTNASQDLGSQEIRRARLKITYLSFAKPFDDDTDKGDSVMLSISFSGLVGNESAKVDMANTDFTYADKTAGQQAIIPGAGSWLKLVDHNTAPTGFNPANYALEIGQVDGYILREGSVMVGNVMANSKVYDKTSVATIQPASSTGYTLICQPPSGESTCSSNLTIDESEAYAFFENPLVGSNKTVHIDGFALRGTDAHLYDFDEPDPVKADITPVMIGILDISVQSKVYDGTLDAYFASTPRLNLSQVLPGDSVMINSEPSISPESLWAQANDENPVQPLGYIASELQPQFKSRNASSNAVAEMPYFSLTGTDSQNYQPVQPDDQIASIYPKYVSFVDVPQDIEKTYDKSTYADLGLASGAFGISQDDVIVGDDVDLDKDTLWGHFVDANAGTAKSIILEGLALEGAHANNYSIWSVHGRGIINPKFVNIHGTEIQDKVYDGTPDAKLIAEPSLTGVYYGDSAYLHPGAPQLKSKNVPTQEDDVEAEFTEFSLYGTQAGNYKIAEPPHERAKIAPAALSIAPIQLTKVQGTSDPSLNVADLANQIEVDLGCGGVDTHAHGTSLCGVDQLVGSFSREAGEEPGVYQITLGTLGVYDEVNDEEPSPNALDAILGALGLKPQAEEVNLLNTNYDLEPLATATLTILPQSAVDTPQDDAANGNQDFANSDASAGVLGGTGLSLNFILLFLILLTSVILRTHIARTPSTRRWP
jgi:hypothetical protein